MLWARAICAWMASCTCCFPVPSTPVFWGAAELCFFGGREGTRELSPRLSAVCSGSLRPSGMTSVVNSMWARRNCVKSPFRMALVRCALEKGCSRLTVPNTTAPAGITWRSNAYTGSRPLAWTGAPARFGARLVRYKRSGTPAGTTKGISCCWLLPSALGAAERMDSAIKPRTRIPALTRMDVGRQCMFRGYGQSNCGAGNSALGSPVGTAFSQRSAFSPDNGGSAGLDASSRSTASNRAAPRLCGGSLARPRHAAGIAFVGDYSAARDFDATVAVSEGSFGRGLSAISYANGSVRERRAWRCFVLSGTILPRPAFDKLDRSYLLPTHPTSFPMRRKQTFSRLDSHWRRRCTPEWKKRCADRHRRRAWRWDRRSLRGSIATGTPKSSRSPATANRR